MAETNQAQKPYERLGEVTIEIGDRRNRSVLFAPLRLQLRGWWKRVNLHGDELSEPMEKLPDIPGMRITIDPRRREGKVFDPIGLPENEALFRRLSDLHLASTKKQLRPEETSITKLTHDNDLKTWLHQLRRIVDAGYGVVIAGTLPEEEDILKLPGKTRCELFNSSARARKFVEDPEPAVA